MMKKVSSGECCHVVQMVGCVSTALPLALALEFVPFGDLLSYLKYWGCKVGFPTYFNNNIHLYIIYTMPQILEEIYKAM